MGSIVGMSFLLLVAIIMVLMKRKNIFSLGSFQPVLYAVLGVSIVATGWFGANFMAEPGLIYHARTIQGAEHAYSSTGWKYQGFGTVFDWKRAMSVSICVSEGQQGVDSDGDSKVASSQLPAVRVVFLDQVDAMVCGTVRFSIPTEQTAFLEMAHEYRSPGNLMRVALEPAVQETIRATANLMTAEEYYSGKQTDFMNDFLVQLQEGIYLVDRREVLKTDIKSRKGGASPADGKEQDEYGDNQQVTYQVSKRIDIEGNPLVKQQVYARFGITVVSANITDVDPNDRFDARMEAQQDASAARAVSREQRLEEEQKKLFVIAKGERQIAEKQAEMRVDQMSKTTVAETNRKEAVIKANATKQKARIDMETAQIKLEQAIIDAEAKTVAADATAYEKAAILAADNALQIKVDAIVEMNRDNAAAFAARKVPHTVFAGGGADGSVPTGNDMGPANFMNIMMMKAARDLDVDLSVATEKDSGQ
jgi:regulator of protease activity HflC (stomatin/prohibitin superfamily)